MFNGTGTGTVLLSCFSTGANAPSLHKFCFDFKRLNRLSTSKIKFTLQMCPLHDLGSLHGINEQNTDNRIRYGIVIVVMEGLGKFVMKVDSRVPGQ